MLSIHKLSMIMSLFAFCCCDAHHRQKQLGEGKHLSVLYIFITLIIEGIQGRNSRQNLEVRNWTRGQGKIILTSLSPVVHLSCFSYKGTTQRELGPPVLAISNNKKCPANLSAGHSGGGILSARVPTSQRSLTRVKLSKHSLNRSVEQWLFYSFMCLERPPRVGVRIQTPVL